MTSDFLDRENRTKSTSFVRYDTKLWENLCTKIFASILIVLSFLFSPVVHSRYLYTTVLYFYGLSWGVPSPPSHLLDYLLRFLLTLIYHQSQRTHHSLLRLHRPHAHSTACPNLSVLMKITNSATLETSVAVPDWAIPACVELRIDLLRAAPSITLLLSSSSSSVQLGAFDSRSVTYRLTLLAAPVELATPHVGVGRQMRVRFDAYASILSVPCWG